MNNTITKTKTEMLIDRIKDLISLVDRQIKAKRREVVSQSFPEPVDFSADDFITLQAIHALRSKVPLNRVVQRLVEIRDEPVHSSTVSATMKRLGNHGLLRSETNENDRRQPLNTLTPRGEGLARRLDEVEKVVLKELVDSLQLDEASVADLSIRVEMAYPLITQPKPTIAGVYDYILGGISNMAVDRKWVNEKVPPQLCDAAKANRAFLQRAVYFLAKEKGITQFLDIGSGFPTNRNTHEVALEINPLANVTYVDNDPDVVRASRNLLHEAENVRVVQKDLKFIRSWLLLDRFQNIDLTKPVGLLMVAVLHFLPDDSEVRDILNFLKKSLAPGSYLVISHSTSEGKHNQVLQTLAKDYKSQVSDAALRSRKAITDLLQGFELVDPELVLISKWKPNLPDMLGGSKQVDPEDSPLLACVAKI
jgi:DNA-binding MarR family transcriptional regulator/trans-aconitate methyltransferase